MKAFYLAFAEAWAGFPKSGHPFKVGTSFQEQVLPALLVQADRPESGREPMPWLAALVCCSVFNLALHDAYDRLLSHSVHDT